MINRLCSNLRWIGFSDPEYQNYIGRLLIFISSKEEHFLPTLYVHMQHLHVSFYSIFKLQIVPSSFQLSVQELTRRAELEWGGYISRIQTSIPHSPRR